MTKYDVRKSPGVQDVINELARLRGNSRCDEVYAFYDNLIDGLINDMYDIQMVIDYLNCAEGTPELLAWLKGEDAS